MSELPFSHPHGEIDGKLWDSSGCFKWLLKEVKGGQVISKHSISFGRNVQLKIKEYKIQ